MIHLYIDAYVLTICLRLCILLYFLLILVDIYVLCTGMRDLSILVSLLLLDSNKMGKV